MRRAVLIAVGLLAMPGAVRAEPPQVVSPAGDDLVTDWNLPVVSTGALMFAGSYGASIVVAATSDHRLCAPLVLALLDSAVVRSLHPRTVVDCRDLRVRPITMALGEPGLALLGRF